MPYSFVPLYLFECVICVLIYIRIKPKSFLIILYEFGSDFYHFLYSCFVLTLFFIVLNMFCVDKMGVRVFRDSLVARKNFRDLSGNSPVAQLKLRVHLKAFATHLVTHENFRDLPSCEKQLFKELFVGNLF